MTYLVGRLKTTTALAGLALLLAAGCSETQLKQFGKNAGENYQCHQENANRPDSAQRQAECNQRQQQRGN